MTNFFQSAWRLIKELGNAYRAWGALCVLAPATYAFYKTHANEPAFLYIALGMLSLLLMALPLIFYHVIRQALIATKHTLVNPKLRLEKRTVRYEITCVMGNTKPAVFITRKQRMDLIALDNDVKHFQFSLSLTGTATAKVTLAVQPIQQISSPALRGPISRRNADIYQVHFPSSLKKNEAISIEFEITVSDPSFTMKPFLAESFCNFAEYGKFEASYKFIGFIPTQVTREVVSAITDHSLEPMQQLMPVQPSLTDVSYGYEVAKVIPNASYVVAWAW